MSKKDGKKKEVDYLVKMSFAGIGAGVVLAIIIASWVWNLIFDPSQFNVTKWLNRTIFNNAISLAMMVVGFVAVHESLKAKEDGKYQKRIGAFLDVVKEIYESVLIVYFDQFINWYSVKQLRNKKIRHLTSQGMARIDAELVVDYASLDEIETLTGLVKGQQPTGKKGKDILKTVRDEDGNEKEVLVPAFEDVYAAYVEEVLSGKIKINVETPAYYLSIDKNKEGNLESLEQPQAVEKERVKAVRRSFISKIIIGVGYLTLMALLVVDYNSDMTSSEAVWEFIFRIASATAGLIGGAFSAVLSINVFIKYIGKKKNVLKEYKQNYEYKEFVPKTRDEIVEEKIKEAKRAREEAIASVVDPVVDTGTSLIPLKEEN